MADLSELFAEQQTSVVEWDGEPLYGLFEFKDVPRHIRLEFRHAKATPVQGLRLRIRGGVIVVDGREFDDVTLWHDTAPTSVEVQVNQSPRGQPSLRLWNVWRGGLDVTQAWLGNAGMRIDGNPEAGHFILRCSDGRGEPTFDDLVVGISTS